MQTNHGKYLLLTKLLTNECTYIIDVKLYDRVSLVQRISSPHFYEVQHLMAVLEWGTQISRINFTRARVDHVVGGFGICYRLNVCAC